MEDISLLWLFPPKSSCGEATDVKFSAVQAAGSPCLTNRDAPARRAAGSRTGPVKSEKLPWPSGGRIERTLRAGHDGPRARDFLSRFQERIPVGRPDQCCLFHGGKDLELSVKCEVCRMTRYRAADIRDHDVVFADIRRTHVVDRQCLALRAVNRRALVVPPVGKRTVPDCLDIKYRSFTNSTILAGRLFI